MDKENNFCATSVLKKIVMASEQSERRNLLVPKRLFCDVFPERWLRPLRVLAMTALLGGWL